MWVYIGTTELKNVYIGEYDFAKYQKVEYIQSSATNPWGDSSSGQYIDTWVTINKNIKIEIDGYFTVNTVQQRLFWGWYDSWSSWISFTVYINWSWYWARATSNWQWNWQSTSKWGVTDRRIATLYNSKFKLVQWNINSTLYDNTNTATISNSDTWTIPLLAYKDRTNNKINRHASAKLYSCKIWDNDVLVRDFVPCYRKSDNEIWLYDMTNKVFYSNAGTGTFTKWVDM